MTEREKESAIHSACYILEDMDMVEVVKSTGLPLGVVAAAYDNIFVKNDSHMVFTVHSGYVVFESKGIHGSEPFVDGSWEETVDKIKDRYNPTTVEILKN